MVLSDGAPVLHDLSPVDVRALRTALAPWRKLTSPFFEGLENIPTDGAVLLVGNHTLYGVLDLPIMVEEIHDKRGRLARGLAENAHYAVPGWRDLLTRAGAVRGTRDNCRALLASGQIVLVYPGGGREVSKRKGEKYRLIWKQRSGFARMAIEAGCPIVPFGAVGAEDSYDIVLDADSPLLAPARELATRLGVRAELMPPLALGVGLSPLPRPERLYFSFGEPIDTSVWNNTADDHAVRTVRDHTKQAVEERIVHLLRMQASDPRRSLVGRVLTR